MFEEHVEKPPRTARKREVRAAPLPHVVELESRSAGSSAVGRRIGLDPKAIDSFAIGQAAIAPGPRTRAQMPHHLATMRLAFVTAKWRQDFVVTGLFSCDSGPLRVLPQARSKAPEWARPARKREMRGSTARSTKHHNNNMITQKPRTAAPFSVKSLPPEFRRSAKNIFTANANSVGSDSSKVVLKEERTGILRLNINIVWQRSRPT